MQNEEVSRQIYSVVCNTAKQGLQMALNYFMNKSIYGKITQTDKTRTSPWRTKPAISVSAWSAYA